MSEPFLMIDDLTEHLGNLPDWYVQVLEARERNACDVCPEEEIEIELVDFSGRPISGEPWFVFMENTNGSAVSAVNADVDPFLNGAGQTTPSPLILKAGSDVVDIAFGGQTPMTLNLTDAEFGVEYDEQLFIVDTPVEYEGPLQIPGPDAAPEIVAYGYLRGVIAAYEAGVPDPALQDMLAEIDTALRAAVGVFPELSLTARNEAEHKLVMGMQLVPFNAHLHPAVVPIYSDVMEIFGDRRSTLPFGAVFVGPDGVSYEDPHLDVVQAAGEDEVNWLGIGDMLDKLQGYSTAFGHYANASLETPQETKMRLSAILRYGGYRFAGPPTQIPKNQIIGGQVKFPSSGAGSNPKTKPVGPYGPIAPIQMQSRRPEKVGGRVLRYMGVTVKIDAKFRHHMSPGDGIKGTRISGTHQNAELRALVRSVGGEIRTVGQPHPLDGRIVAMEYRLPKSDGTWGPWRPKTVYDMPNSEFIGLTRQAVRNSLIRNSGSLPNSGWEGSTRTGIRIQGHSTELGPASYRTTTAFFMPW